MLADDILQLTLDEARAAGADYAEARHERIRSQQIGAHNSSVERLTSDLDEGWGVHAYAGGGWGFASSAGTTPQQVRATARYAVDLARAAGVRRKSVSDLSLMPTGSGEYRTPISVDPFSVPVADCTALLLDSAARAGRAPRVKVVTGELSSRSKEKLYKNSSGARFSQLIYEVGAELHAVAVDDTGYAYRRSISNGNMSQAGWEFIEAMDLPAQAERAGQEASELVAAPWAPDGPTNLVIASNFVALMVHETCGHPTELDRVLGWEAAFAGTSFLMPDMLGSFRYGSPHVNMTADSLLPGGLGTFGWDDEGTPAQRSPIVRDGIFTGYLSSRESAHVLGQGSNGCARATSWGRIPLVRMVNVSLEPGSGTFDELISGVDDGLYIETPSSWSLDDKRMNFHFSAELCREIRGGKLGELRKGASFQGRTPQFWGSVSAVAGVEEWKLWGLANCAKGEPLQLCPVSHGASPILAEGVTVTASGRH